MPTARVRSGLFFAAAVSLAACPPRTRTAAPRDGAARDGGHSLAGGGADAGHDPCASLTPEQRALVVARVGDDTFTLCDFATRINSQNQYLRARFAAPEQRRALLRNWVDSELLAAEARARGLDREPAVAHAIVSQLARQVENDVRSHVEPPTVTDADVDAYFAAHHAEYDTPEQVRASQIVLPTRARADAVLADVRAHAQDEAYWRTTAGRESVDVTSRTSGGDLGFFGVQGSPTVPPEVATAAFGLHTVGEIAPTVIETAHGGPGHLAGFHLVRLMARRDALHRTLDEVRRPIHNRLWRERFDAAQQAAVQSLVDRLRSDAHVSIDEGALAQIHLDVAPDAGTTLPVAPAP